MPDPARSIQVYGWLAGATIVLSVLKVASVAWFFWTTEYAAFVDALKTTYSGAFLIERIEMDYFTHRQFVFARALILGVAIAGVALLLVWAVYWQRIGKFLYTATKEVIGIGRKGVDILRNLSAVQQWLLVGMLITSFGMHVYYALQFPFYVDEVFSYVFFVSQGWDVTLSHYPFANNHVLYNVLASLPAALVDDPVWIMRLPSLLAGVGVLLLLFVSAHHFFGFSTAWLATLPIAFLYPTSMYAVYGRGHLLMCLLALLATFTIFKFTVNKANASNYLMLFTLSSILAAFTVPLYIYQFICLLTFALGVTFTRGEWPKSLAILWAAAFTGLGVFICYLPILLISGLPALFGNKWGVPQHTFFFYTHIFPIASAEMLDFMVGTYRKGYVWGIGFVLVVGLFWWKSPRASTQVVWCWLVAWIGIATFCLVLIHGVFPPYRGMLYLLPYLYLTGAIALVYAIKRWFRFTMLFMGVAAVGCMMLGIMQLQRALADTLANDFYSQCNRQVREVYEMRPKYVFISKSDGYFHFYLRLKYGVEKATVKLHTGNPVPGIRYDVVICEQVPFPAALDSTQYVLTETNELRKIYRAKSR